MGYGVCISCHGIQTSRAYKFLFLFIGWKGMKDHPHLSMFLYTYSVRSQLQPVKNTRDASFLMMTTTSIIIIIIIIISGIGQYWAVLGWMSNIGKSLKPPRHRCLRNAEDRNLEVLEGGSTSRSHDVREPLSKWINVDDISGLYDTTVPTVSNMIVILSKIIYYHTIIIPTSNNAIYIIIIKK